jgi:hypothetical protein
VAVLVGGVYMVRSINQQQLGKNTKAAGNTFDCSSIVPSGVPNRNIYVKIVNGVKKYYKDNGYKYEITEGVANYCKANITNTTTCINVGHLVDCKRPVYKKGTNYYTNSSCLGVIGIDSNGTFEPVTSDNIKNEYCEKPISQLIPLQYDCPSPMADVKFYYQNGQYYKDIKKTIKVTDFGVGNFCKIISPSGGASNRLKKTLITSSCKELGIDMGQNKQDRPISFYAEDLSKDVNNFSAYFFGTSKASAYGNYQAAQGYCQAQNGSNYVYSNCLPRLCSNSDKSYWMKNGVIYNNNSCNTNTKTTYALACQ